MRLVRFAAFLILFSLRLRIEASFDMLRHCMSRRAIAFGPTTFSLPSIFWLILKEPKRFG